jgi:uncharacterized membrane protein
MKNTILAALMLLVMSFISHAEVRNSLQIKNNTEETVSIAYAWYNKQEQCWKTKGWISIKPYGDFVIDFGWKGIDLGNHTWHVCAKSKNKQWLGNTEFRIDSTQDFEISFANNFTPKMQTAKFNSIETRNGNTIYTINP